jgi:thymidine kinase
MIRNMTYGERLLRDRMNELPSDQFSSSLEPALTLDGNTFHPDGVIACWEHGIVVIEVKDWKNLLKGTNQETCFIKDHDGNVIQEENPEAQAWGYVRQLARLLESEKVLAQENNKGLVLPWQHMVIFSTIPQANIDYWLSRSKVFSKGFVFGKEVLANRKNFQQALINLPWKFKPPVPPTAEQKATIRRIIKPTLEISGRRTLSVLQETLAEEPIDSEKRTLRLVRGVAGSGKSLVLVKRAHYLHENYPDKKMLVLSFNSALADKLKDDIVFDEVEVKTFHKFCSDILGNQWIYPQKIGKYLTDHESQFIKKSGLDIDFVGDELLWRKDISLWDNEIYLTIERRGRGKALQQSQRIIINEIFERYAKWQSEQKQKDYKAWADWSDVPHEAFNVLTDTHAYYQKYDVILLDEAQDFAPSWIKIIRQVLAPKGHLFICDDPTQSLIRQFSWNEKELPVRGRTRILTVPYRSTRQINLLAHKLIDSDMNLAGSDEITKPELDSIELVEGEKPYLALLENIEDENTFIHDEVLRLIGMGIEPEEIAILSPDSNNRRWVAIKKDYGVTTLSYNRMKGLEFRVVILPMLGYLFESEGTMDEGQLTDARRHLFTAMTRAREILIMSHYSLTIPHALEPILPYMNYEVAITGNDF